jgi:hypothetical protein
LNVALKLNVTLCGRNLVDRYERFGANFRIEEFAEREKKGEDMGMEKQEPGLREIQWEKVALKKPNAFKG